MAHLFWTFARKKRDFSSTLELAQVAQLDILNSKWWRDQFSGKVKEISERIFLWCLRFLSGKDSKLLAEVVSFLVLKNLLFLLNPYFSKKSWINNTGGLVIRSHFWLVMRPHFFRGSQVAIYKTLFFSDGKNLQKVFFQIWLSIRLHLNFWKRIFCKKGEVTITLAFWCSLTTDFLAYKTRVLKIWVRRNDRYKN